MKRRPLGRTGLSVSEIGFGCGPTAGLMVRGDEKTRRDAVACALELGIDYFDTAPAYGDTLSELHLGATLRALGAKPFIATKIALELPDLADIPGAVTRSVEGSIARLGVKCLDLVQLHNRVATTRAAKADIGTGAMLTVDDVLAADGVVPTLERLRARGRVTNVGCCAYGGDPTSVARLIDSGAFATILLHYSLANSSAFGPCPMGMRDYAQLGTRASAAGMGAIALRVLDGGALLNDTASGLQALAQEAGGDLPALALRYALSNESIATALVGFSDRRQIEAAYAAAQAGPLPTLIRTRINP
ncbi:MAG TPA: aldo/keto reductase [Stellaceae bacterium]|jgi:L-galactose dehydrogenase/L-glyceraldehyde 3-phosphate reductase|nr:aldo/keto reductase [Stellaceae bacterium]